MNGKTFEQLVANRCQKITDTLASKGAEYSTDTNKLHNFDKASRMSGLTREQALKGMLLKHEVSISDIIEKTKDDKFPSIEVIDEKIGDIINYYILLEACLVDRINQEKVSFDSFIGSKYPKTKNKSFSLEGPNLDMADSET